MQSLESKKCMIFFSGMKGKAQHRGEWQGIYLHILQVLLNIYEQSLDQALEIHW